MGRKPGTLYINPKKFGALQKPCLKETMSFLSCLAMNNGTDKHCERQKKFLGDCMLAQTGKAKKPWGSINYHLQRLVKGGK